MDLVKIGERAPLIEKVLFINGITRVGKFFAGKLINGLNDIEYYQYISPLEHIPYLERLGTINRDAAKALLQVNVDEHSYNYYIGRNLNTRYDDASAIHNTLEEDIYLRRGLSPVSTDLVKEIRQNNRYSSYILHECLANIDLFLETFPKLKWIDLQRNPIDLIYSWHKRDWGNRMQTDPLSFILLAEAKDCASPWYAYEWIDEYRSMSGIDRIIKVIATLIKLEEQAYARLKAEDKNKILFLSYERLVEETQTEIDRISKFLEVEISKRLPVIMTRENCPTLIDPQQRLRKTAEIKDIASDALFKEMIGLERAYNAKKWE
jgi:hypothetical protein